MFTCLKILLTLHFLFILIISSHGFDTCFRYKSEMGFWSSRSVFQLLMLAMSLCLMDRVQAATIDNSCPPNTKYGCVRICYGNCDSLNSTTEACILPCKLGCDCTKGYVFKSKDSKVCVPPSECKVTCPEHMTFKPCLRTLRKTCNTLGTSDQPFETCMPRCVCDEGYVLSNEPKPKCIKISQCPKQSSD